MKKLLFLVILAGVIYFVYTKYGDTLFSVRTTKSHRSTASLFMDATLGRNLIQMKSYCSGAAVERCESVLAEINARNPTFARYGLEIGGVTGDRVSGQALCYGENGDMFITVLLTLENRNGT